MRLEFYVYKNFHINLLEHQNRVSHTWFWLSGRLMWKFLYWSKKQTWRTKKKNEAERRKRRRKKEKKKRPTLWSHLQNQTHPQQNQIHPFIAISTNKTKPTCKKIFLSFCLCSLNPKPKSSVLDSKSTCTKKSTSASGRA